MASTHAYSCLLCSSPTWRERDTGCAPYEMTSRSWAWLMLLLLQTHTALHPLPIKKVLSLPRPTCTAVSRERYEHRERERERRRERERETGRRTNIIFLYLKRSFWEEVKGRQGSSHRFALRFAIFTNLLQIDRKLLQKVFFSSFKLVAAWHLKNR